MSFSNDCEANLGKCEKEDKWKCDDCGNRVCDSHYHGSSRDQGFHYICTECYEKRRR